MSFEGMAQGDNLDKLLYEMQQEKSCKRDDNPDDDDDNDGNVLARAQSAEADGQWEGKEVYIPTDLDTVREGVRACIGGGTVHVEQGEGFCKLLVSRS